MTTYRLYGLNVDCDFPLHVPEVDARPQLRFRRVTADRQSDALPAGELLLDYSHDGRHMYAASRGHDGGLLFRVYGVLDVLVSPDRRELVFAVLAGIDPEMASVFATGAVPALLMTLSGTQVLHASAVTADDGTTVACLGRSGQGKSTLATLMCLDGAELVTDDVLPVVGIDPVRVASGAREIRLRPQSDSIVASSVAPTRQSADGRTVVAFRSDAEREPRRLDAILVPIPNREGVLELLRLPRQQAHLTILRYPRLLGWRDREVLRAHFELASAIVDQVPVLLARVPWGPPFRPDIVPALWRAVRQPASVEQLDGQSRSDR